jgi:hypothetical protein
MTWLTGWDYRQSHLISHAANAGTLYQVKILVHSGSGSSSGNDVYLKGHCLDFPNDIDFTSDNGSTQLDFWVEDLTADPITVWVEVAADLTTDDKTIYIYYGKSGQSSLSNGANTFIVFDHFLGTSLDTNVWETHGSPTVSVADSWVTVSSTTTNWKGIDAKIGQNAACRLKMRGQLPDYAAGKYEVLGFMIHVNPATDYALFYSATGAYTCSYFHTTYHDQAVTLTTNVAIYEHLWKTGEFKSYMNNALKATENEAAHTPVNTMYPTAAVYGTSSSKLDWIFLSKFVSPEPANSTWGAEEGTTSTLAGITRNSTGDPLGNCSVYIFRTIDDLFLGSGTSDDDGNYSISVPVGAGTEVFAVAFKSGSPDVMGVTDNDIQTA